MLLCRREIHLVRKLSLNTSSLRPPPEASFTVRDDDVHGTVSLFASSAVWAWGTPAGSVALTVTT